MMNEDLIKEIEALKKKGNERDIVDYGRLKEIHNSVVTGEKYDGSSCGGCYQRAFKNLDELIKNYKDGTIK